MKLALRSKLIWLTLSLALVAGFFAFANQFNSSPAGNGPTLGEYFKPNAAGETPWVPETGIAESQWPAALKDPTIHIDSDLKAFVIDQFDILQSAGSPTVTDDAVSDIPKSSAFTLHSRPGALRTLYLDFNGHNMAGTRQGTSYGVASLAAYNLEGLDTDFSDLERTRIIQMWSTVAEDYAPFNIDVTTEEPANDLLNRSSTSDQYFGTRAIISSGSNAIKTSCGCAGLASMDDVTTIRTATGANTTALIFADSFAITESGVSVGATVSHETGHNFGLDHDGTASSSYYAGHNGWGSIMGSAHDLPLDTWSKGEYPGANNQQDDFAIIAAGGAPLMADDFADTLSAASLVNANSKTLGLISTRADLDYFKFVASADTTTLAAYSRFNAPNLDIALSVYAASGALISTTDPVYSKLATWSSVGLDASTTFATTAGQTYYVSIDGVGKGDTATGYSDFASVGTYYLEISGRPSITSISDASPFVGGTVTFAGTYMNTITEVTYAGATVPIVSKTADSLSVAMPAVTANTVSGTFILSNASYAVTSPSVSATIPVTGVELPTQIRLNPGMKRQLSLITTPTWATTRTATWTSSNTAVATVDAQGVVRAKSNGSTTITATSVSGFITATSTVTVQSAAVTPMQNIALNSSKETLLVGATFAAVATAFPVGSDDSSLSWSSSDSSIASVSNGTVTAVAPGVATITVKSIAHGLSASLQVTIVPVQANDVANTVTGLTTAMSFSVDGGRTWTAYTGTNLPNLTFNLELRVKYTSGAPVATVYPLVFSDSTVAANPQATVRAGVRYLSDLTPITSVQGLEPTLFDETWDYHAASGVLLKGTATAANSMFKGSPTIKGIAYAKGITLVSGGALTYKIPAGTSTFTSVVGLGDGANSGEFAYFEAYLDGQLAYASPVLGVWRSGTTRTTGPVAVSIPVGSANSLTIKTINSSGGFARYDYGIWGGAGFVQGVTNLTSSPAAASVTVGSTQQLTATLSSSAGVSTGLTWSSSDTSVATVDANGLLTAVKMGSAVITATSAANPLFKSTSLISVKVAAGTTSLSSATSSLSLAVNGTSTIVTTISGAAGYNSTLSWTSSNSAVATVSQSGVVTAVGNGVATVYAATADNFEVAVQVTVGTGTAAAMTLTPAPTISGTPSVGQTLTAVTGTWDSGVAFSYVWLRNGTPISGATVATYVLTATDAGTTISVSVTGSKAGFDPVAVSSVGVVAGGSQFSATPAPTISGNAGVGQTLTANSGTWVESPSFGYQWMRSGAAIAGATAQTYVLTAADLSAVITVRVTASKAGYASATVTSAGTSAVTAGTISSQPVPTVSGAATVGGTLTLATGTWDPGVTFTYQWMRAGTAIVSATGQTYVLTSADLGAAISVAVTGTKAGFATATQTSLASTPVAGALTLQPVPTISGSTSVASVLTATTGTWDSGVTFTYQWLRNGVAISGATSSTYTLVSADLNAVITVAVTGSKASYTSVTKTSLATALISNNGTALTLTPTPIISGTTQVGMTLTATSGTWDTGVALTYQWSRNGVAIASATSASYTLVTADLGSTLTVAVTGTKVNFTTVTKTSTVSGIVTSLALALTPTPTISGTAQAGNALTAVPGTWDAGVTFTYQWLRNGTPVAGATSASYALQGTDVGATIAVSVTGNSVGYASVTKSSVATAAVAAGSFTSQPVPTISGNLTVGSVLTANPGSWPVGTTITYVWYRNSSVIAGATTSTYTLVSADRTRGISVAIKATSPGYTSVSVLSAQTAVIGYGTLTLQPTPTISGSTSVGSTLTALPGTWDAGVALTYVWKRNGTNISGATTASYVLVAADLTKTITVQVKGTLAGYTAVTKLSAATAAIASASANASFTLVGTPTITGVAKIRDTLTAAPGTWDSGAAFTYQWMRGGVAIAGATASTYVLTADDFDLPMQVSVTATKAGFNSVQKLSAETALVDLANMVLMPQPTILGVAEVGATLTASLGTWDNGVATTQQWIRNGVDIAGETALTYVVTSADLGATISVRVRGALIGCATILRTSYSTAAVTLPAITTAATPTISGTLALGEVLTATTGVWTPGVSFRYQWMRNGRAITGATASTYKLVDADLGAAISLKVVGDKASYKSETKTSSETTRVARPTFSSTPTPVITGTATVGQILTGDAGNWGADVTIKYQWKRDGRSISRATASTYTLVSADLGKAITLTVTVFKVGYSRTTVTSAATAAVN